MFKINMRHKKKLFILILIYFTRTNTESIVYNFKIAQITKSADTHNNVFNFLTFNLYREKYNCVQKNFTGELVSYIHNLRPYYFRIDTAYGYFFEKVNNQKTFKGENLDDILITFGKTFHQECKNDTLSCLIGIPTHHATSLDPINFGVGQYSLGIQFDTLHKIGKQDLLFGCRFLHFFPRKIYNADYYGYKFTPGSLIDLLAGYKKNWTSTGIEFGYNLAFRFNAQLEGDDNINKNQEILEKYNINRSSFFLALNYFFNTCDIKNKIFLIMSAGFDHKPEPFKVKKLFNCSLSWALSY
jgi:hypothetical protein